MKILLEILKLELSLGGFMSNKLNTCIIFIIDFFLFQINSDQCAFRWTSMLT